MSSDPPAVVFEHCVTGGGRPVFFGKAPLYQPDIQLLISINSNLYIYFLVINGIHMDIPSGYLSYLI